MKPSHPGNSSRNEDPAVDYFYSAAMHRSRGVLWPSFAPARIALPEDPNLIATPVPDKVMEPDAPMDAAIFDDVLPTQGYLDDLPRAEVYGPPTHLTTYFLGRVIYESLGRSYENDFCVYLVRRSTNPFATDLPEDFGDPNYMFMKCSAERNGQHEIQQKTGR
jgi:hypothetical protein